MYVWLCSICTLTEQHTVEWGVTGWHVAAQACCTALDMDIRMLARQKHVSETMMVRFLGSHVVGSPLAP